MALGLGLTAFTLTLTLTLLALLTSLLLAVVPMHLSITYTHDAREAARRESSSATAYTCFAPRPTGGILK